MLPTRKADPALQGVPLFRKHLPQCTTSRLCPVVHASLDGAAKAVAFFATSVLRNCDEYWGTVGVQPWMQSALDDMADCWDFSSLLFQVPAPQQLAAFGRVAEMVRPFIKYIKWPNTMEYPYVEHSWPTAERLSQQYLLLCSRLRCRAQTQPWCSFWLEPCAYLAQPIRNFPLIEELLRNLWKTTHTGNKVNPITIATLSFSINAFLVDSSANNVGLDQSFLVKAEAVKIVSSTRPAQGKHLHVRPGDFAILQNRPFVGKLVIIKEVRSKVNETAALVTACLDKSFNAPAGNEHASHCWHAVYLLLHNRSMNSCSSNCERIGSLLHMLFEPDSKMSPARVCNRLRMREAGMLFTGGARDEVFVADICDVLISAGKTPFIQRAARAKRRKVDSSSVGSNLAIQRNIQEANAKVNVEGRGIIHMDSLDGVEGPFQSRLMDFLQNLPEHRREFHETHRPQDLDSQTKGLFKRIISKTKTNEGTTFHVEPVPAFVQRSRSTRDSVVTSTRRAALASWLKTDEGLEWQAQRAKLWDAFCQEQHSKL